MQHLNPFEQHLLLFAKNHYHYAGDRVSGALVMVSHLAGSSIEDARPRDVAMWLVNVLVAIDRKSPQSIPGGLGHALTELLSHLAQEGEMAGEVAVQAYWRSVVANLLSRVALTNTKAGDVVLYELPPIDPALQAALDQVAENAPAATHTVKVPTFYGVHPCQATIEQAVRLGTEKEQVFAELLGLSTAAEYQEWLQSEGSVFCADRGGRDRRCRNHLPGKARLDPVAWNQAKAIGGLCCIHQ